MFWLSIAKICLERWKCYSVLVVWLCPTVKGRAGALNRFGGTIPPSCFWGNRDGLLLVTCGGKGGGWDSNLNQNLLDVHLSAIAVGNPTARTGLYR